MKTIIAVLLFASAQVAIGLMCYECNYSNIANPLGVDINCYNDTTKLTAVNCAEETGKIPYCETKYGEKEGNVTVNRKCILLAAAPESECTRKTDNSISIETCQCKTEKCNTRKEYTSGAGITSVFFLLPIMGLVANLS